MKKAEIKIGGLYLAKVAGAVTTVRVDAIRDRSGFGTLRHTTVYDVTNMRTGRTTTFRSAAKFRGRAPTTDAVGTPEPQPDPTAPPAEAHAASGEGEQRSDPTTASTVAPTTSSGETTAKAAGETCADVVLGADCVTTYSTRAPVASSNKEDEQSSDPHSTACGKTGVAPTSVTTAPLVGPLSGQMSEADSATVPSANSFGRLASRIAAINRIAREVGSPVAGMVPNEEQESILAAAVEHGLKTLVIGAGAGTGKTATLKMLEQVLPGRGQYTAFNASLVAEGKTKFTKAACNTTHSLAFRAVGRKYQHRLNSERMRSGQIAHILGVEDFTVLLKGQGPPEECDECTGNDTECKKCDGVGLYHTDKQKVLRADFLAGQVLVAIRRFCQSADHEITTDHFGFIDGIDAEIIDTYDDASGKMRQRRSRKNQDKVRSYLLLFARKAWEDLSKVDGQLPFSHDCYVKLWQLGQGSDRPIISADYILLDEAQDTAPVFLDVLKQQRHALLIFVGDSNQAIYEWRGAVDAMKAYPDATRRMLSQSYRFGQAVADVANTILATLEEPTDLVMRGMPGLPSRVAEVNEPRCYLYRTNAGAVGRVMTAIEAGKNPHLIGGGADVVAWCQAAMDLQARRGTRHPELCCFDTWKEVVEYSKTDEGSDLRLMVKLIDHFGAEEIRNALRNMPDEEDADLVVSTAHKSKGREWDTVVLGPDFPLVNKMTDPDRRLLYVAATRAKLTLDISECPPFCGGNDGGNTGNAETSGAWVPGLRVMYTQPMPSEEDQAAWRAGGNAYVAQGGGPPKSGPLADPIPQNAAGADVGVPGATGPMPNGNGGNGRANFRRVEEGQFTWTNNNGKWCVVGPRTAEVGDRVKVTRKNGTSSMETLKRVIKTWGNDAYVYEV